MPSGRQDDIEDRISHVILNRVDRICLVLECCSDNKNYLACLRTCDILGIQNVWIVEEPLPASHPIQHLCTGSVDQPNGCVQLKAQQDKRSSVEQVGFAGHLHAAASLTALSWLKPCSDYVTHSQAGTSGRAAAVERQRPISWLC